MTKKSLNSLLRRSEILQPEPPATRDSVEKDIETERVKTRTYARKVSQSVTPPIQSKITFEGDDNSELSDLTSETSETNIKIERVDSENTDTTVNNEDCPAPDENEVNKSVDEEHQSPILQNESQMPEPSNDIVDYPHFKISITESGAKEYFCCVNGNYHFKTSLLISMKKHAQLKHAEKWDGYCYVCKVIVTPQGEHSFRDCLQHYLDKHMDNFPIFEKEIEPAPLDVPAANCEPHVANQETSKPYINVRPISDLVNKADVTESQETATLPVIQSVMSLGAAVVDPPRTMSLGGAVVDPSRTSPCYPSFLQEERPEEKIYKYEEHQAEILSKKYYLVIQTMMMPENLVKLFKCAGRYCLYATDSAEEALAHATTHQRIGGVNTLNCCYCDFDSAGNAVDLVMHVFKHHGSCQYCCKQCFYRAASSQAVGAHITRVHQVAPAPGSVLRSTTVSTIPLVKHTILTREQAVSHYVCGHSDRDSPCKFRTYPPDVFCDHLLQRHTTATAHPCHLCSVEVSSATDLVQHMKIHGLKLYQCTWCVHGADSEGELLSHVSAVHPDKQPQAYIRIMTNKDGAAERRVLPLAFLNKNKVPSKDVDPVPTKEHPVREAERSLEMEALIGPFLTGPSPPAATAEPTEPSIQTAHLPDEIIGSPKDIKPPKDIQIPEPSTVQEPVVAQPSISTPVDTAISLPQVIVKTEPVETGKDAVPAVVVLDSDDEDATIIPTPQPVIDLSEVESTSTSKDVSKPKKVSTTVLYTCPRCKQVCKNMGGLKKHIYSCAINTPNLRCPHCGCPAENLEKLVWHYVADHSELNTFECGVCGALLVTENFARKHFKTDHKDSNIVITPNEKEGQARFTIHARKKSTETSKERVAPKRKLSGPNVDSTPTKRRFEPQEIDQLPINPILDHLVYCSRCEFSTKVRLNMVRHLQLHAEQQPVPQTAPVNPVPHLESNEKHFDKMVNLASSSIVNRAEQNKARPEPAPSVLMIPPEAASRYPKFVSERQRHTCGAKGCSYISVDEAMLRCHWDTLHSGTSDFHCVHCPPHQHLDTSKPLTATRIISHLKMHDATLYACSSCSYYHFKREALEKHLNEVHKGGRLMVVREEHSAPPVVTPAPVQTNAAPTMDLKPWQCGLCKFKSMLRPEVVDHCSRIHQSKMQFKCAYCPFRTSTIENISKHQVNSHAGKPEEIFYYYYREGSIPDEADGTPRWMRQHQKMNAFEAEVKVEATASSVPKVAPLEPVASPPIDLNIVKKEVPEVPKSTENTTEGLCRLFGKICDPNGIKFKCPLCSDVMDDTRDGMRLHLYEELNYRKWRCGLCSYKAFHKAGLTDHMTSEHRRQYDHIELPTDQNIEKWVTCVLNHQEGIIEQHKQNLLKQKIVTVKTSNKPGPSNEVVVPKEPAVAYSDKDLETAFGSLGHTNDSLFCCPKCDFLISEDVAMRDHLEMELNKIRWCCSNCTENFQTYHEARFHTKGHDGPSRPIEAIRNPIMRAAWITRCIQKQRIAMQSTPVSADAETTPTPDTNIDSDNSLLVVRYEERVPTPDLVNAKRKRTAPSAAPTSAQATTSVSQAHPPPQESDDEKLVIDEPSPKKKPERQCPYCDYKTTYYNNVKPHMLTHFGLKPYTCGYCNFNSNKNAMVKHIEQMHPEKPLKTKMTELPPEARKAADPDVPKVICLVCEKAVPETATDSHLHINVKPQFAKGDIVVKCCVCLELCLDAVALQEHHNAAHPNEAVNYALYKLGYDSRETYRCTYCSNRFRYLKDYKAHHTAAHADMPFNIKSSSYTPPDVNSERRPEAGTAPVVHKRCARKSTTKLPNTVARKSTTKLPYSVPSSSSDDEYSYYGSKPAPLQQYGNVTTLMSFCNKMMPFTVKQLSELLNIEPKVVVTDINHSSD